MVWRGHRKREKEDAPNNSGPVVSCGSMLCCHGRGITFARVFLCDGTNNTHKCFPLRGRATALNTYGKFGLGLRQKIRR